MSIRIAVIGLGRIAWEFHLPAICADPGFELVAVVDPIEERIAETRRKFPAGNGFTDYRSMIGELRPDAVVVASPTCFHAEQVLYALEHGCDVFCDKPLAPNLSECREIAAALERTGRKLMLYQPHRVTPEAEALKRIIADKLLGDLFMVRKVCAAYQRRNDWQAWRANGGGMLNNYGSHFVDQFLHIFGGGVTFAHFENRTVISCGDAEDVVKAMLVNRAGVILDLEINMAGAFSGAEWIVHGSCGSARLDGVERCWTVKYLVPAELPPLPVQQELAAAGRRYPGEELAWHSCRYPLAEAQAGTYYRNLAGYLSGTGEPLVSFQETMTLMEILERGRK